MAEEKQEPYGERMIIMRFPQEKMEVFYPGVYTPE